MVSLAEREWHGAWANHPRGSEASRAEEGPPFRQGKLQREKKPHFPKWLHLQGMLESECSLSLLANGCYAVAPLKREVNPTFPILAPPGIGHLSTHSLWIPWPTSYFKIIWVIVSPGAMRSRRNWHLMTTRGGGVMLSARGRGGFKGIWNLMI